MMFPITKEDLERQVVKALGLDSAALDIPSVECVAALLRRVAGFICPCGAHALTRAVVDCCREVVVEKENLKTLVEEVLEAMVAYGDLLEAQDVLASAKDLSCSWLYPAPPSFVLRKSGKVLLLGISPGLISALTPDMEELIVYSRHVRYLPPCKNDIGQYLHEIGLVEQKENTWLRLPSEVSALDLRQKIDSRLEAQPIRAESCKLTILDPTTSSRSYRKRWKEPERYTGRFVARREQAYGSDIWCYAEIRDGVAIRMVDLPDKDSRYRGCDEAWQLQEAIDKISGNQQIVHVCSGRGDRRILKFFSPIPMWATRRLDAVAEPVVPDQQCLFAYCVSNEEFAQEKDFLASRLWLLVDGN